MAIDKADILSAVQDNMPQASSLTATTFARHLRRALKLLSATENILQTSASLTLVDGTQSLDYPDNCKAIESITLNDGTTESDPLVEMNWDDYLDKMEDFLAASGEDEPTYFVDHDRTIYFWRPSDSSYTGTVDYFQFHPDSVDSILFPDEWFGAIESLSTWLVARRYGRTRYMALWGGQTEPEAVAFAINDLHAQYHEGVNMMAYNDL